MRSADEQIVLFIQMEKAIGDGDAQALAYYLEEGADPNTTMPTLKKSAMMFALEEGNPAVIEVLWLAGARLNAAELAITEYLDEGADTQYADLLKQWHDLPGMPHLNHLMKIGEKCTPETLWKVHNVRFNPLMHLQALKESPLQSDLPIPDIVHEGRVESSPALDEEHLLGQ